MVVVVDIVDHCLDLFIIFAIYLKMIFPSVIFLAQEMLAKLFV